MYINTGKHGYFQQILTVILLSKEWYVPQGIVGRGREQRKVATFLNSLWQIYYFSGFYDAYGICQFFKKHYFVKVYFKYIPVHDF